ncbi:MAG TPA: hypothetical protein VFW35_08265 [Sphingomicrobium sp.]|nr:hypothetical protein [Sphingomicrobium sp.]
MAHHVFGGAESREAAGGAMLRVAFLLTALAFLALSPARAFAASGNVQITGLSDINFGTLSNFSVDAVRAESVCVYSTTGNYQVTATGSGSSNSFALSASGGKRLAYDVQWNSQAGQASGTQLTSNSALTGRASTATTAACTTGPTTSASLIVIIRASTLSSAQVGSYSGTLTLLIGPN